MPRSVGQMQTPLNNFLPLLPLDRGPTDAPVPSTRRTYSTPEKSNELDDLQAPPVSTLTPSDPSFTPFDAPLPERIPKKYWMNTSSGMNYALYSLVHMGRDDMAELLQTLRFHAEADNCFWTHRVVRAPIYDFCSNNKTLRDIYDYHTSLIEAGDNIAPSRFIVVGNQDWENQGVLLVDLDCQVADRGTLGIMRAEVEVVTHCLMLLEKSNANFSPLKASELDTKWSEPILGYTSTPWQRLGYSCVRHPAYSRSMSHF